MAENLKRDQFDNILLDFQANSLPETFLINTVARRAALKDNFKPLGYPSLHFFNRHNLIDDTMLRLPPKFQNMEGIMCYLQILHN